MLISFFFLRCCALFRQFCLELNGLAVKLQVSQIVPPSTDAPSVWWSYQLVLVSPSSRVSAIQTPAPRWQPPSSGSFSVLLTRPLKRPVRAAVAQLSLFSHGRIYVAENGINLCVLLLCQQCPAIDYTRHTLDGAACLLNSNKYFPSRSVFQNQSFILL